MTPKLVTRKGTKAVFAFAGVSGGGKTYTALQFGFGLANNRADKVGLLDTENGRGKLYEDDMPDGKPFYYLPLDPPFEPERYIEGIAALEKIGCEVIIIDSMSHEYAGEGGILEMADTASRYNPYTKKEEPIQGMEKWLKPKMRHKKFINALLQSKAHIICCLRALPKTQYEDVWNEKKGKMERTVVTTEQPIPICEKNFMYEMTHSLILEDEGKIQITTKAHKDFLPFLGRGKGYITSTDGLACRDWLDGMSPKEDVIKFRCADCNNYIMPTDKFTTQQIADGTMIKYGRYLCADCGAKEKGKGANNG